MKCTSYITEPDLLHSRLPLISYYGNQIVDLQHSWYNLWVEGKMDTAKSCDLWTAILTRLSFLVQATGEQIICLYHHFVTNGRISEGNF